MAQWKRTLDRVLSGSSDTGVRFDDLRNLLTRFGFSERIRGAHYIYVRDGVEEILNLQPRNAQAKPYQVKQVRAVFVKYELTPKDDMK